MSKLFKIDTHTHTSETSLCGYLSATELVDLYVTHGYDGIVITDHLHDEYISALDCKNNWGACIDLFLRGYKHAKERGDKIGLQVILGAEIRFEEINDSDYLLYGIDEEFLRKNPYLHRLGPWEFFRRFGDDILIIHAHPFRNGNEIVFTECVHGIEVFNGNPRHENYTEKAIALCEEIPGLYRFSGSDAHRVGDVGSEYMLFNELVCNSHAFHSAVKQNGFLCGRSCKTKA